MEKNGKPFFFFVICSKIKELKMLSFLFVIC